MFEQTIYHHGVAPHVKHVLEFLVLVDAVGCGLLIWPRLRAWSLGVAAVLLGAAALWARDNKSVEGGILHVLSPGHGIVVSDMISVQAGLTAVAIAGRYALQCRQSLPADFSGTGAVAARLLRAWRRGTGRPTSSSEPS